MKHWSRRLAGIGIALALCLAAALPAWAAEPPRLLAVPQSQQVMPGEALRVEIQLDGMAEELGGLQFTFTYDPDLLGYQGYLWGGAYQENVLAATVHLVQEGEVRVIFVSKDSTTADGMVIALDLLALEGTGSTELTLRDAQVVSAQPVQQLALEVQGSTVQVGQPSSPTPVVTASPAPTATATATVLPTPTATAAHSSSHDHDDSGDETPTATPASTVVPVPAAPVTATPARTAAPTTAPTATPTASPSPTPAATATPGSTLTPSPSLTPTPTATAAPTADSQPPSLLWLLALAAVLAFATGVIVYLHGRKNRR